MKEKICFERFLYGDSNPIIIDDIDFCVDRMIMLPKIRSHQLEKAVRLSVTYCGITDFRQKILEKINECPVLIYQLVKRGIFEFEEIAPFLSNRDTFLLCHYFREQIRDFESFIQSKNKPCSHELIFFENTNDIDQLIEFGFVKSSIEYCLKFDFIENIVIYDILNQEAKWSPFEWSFKPENLDLLSFSGFFGSIKCFKYLLMKGFEINQGTISMVVCSGCYDLYHLCKGQQFLTPDIFLKTSEFCQLPLLVFMIENGFDINTKNADVEF